jgi:aldehyde dehydrogenase (NAD+)
MDNVSLDSPLMGEEIFGPILPVFAYKNMADAVEIIQAHPNPLAFYIFTSRKENASAWIESVSFGSGCVNNANMQFANLHLPFGGIGQSGMGAYHGKYSFELFSHPKPVLSTPVWFDPSVKYPPFRGKLKWFKFLIR